MTVPGKRTTLYRHYDACGCLLYVGISYDAEARKYEHAARSWWSKWSAKLVVDKEIFETRQDAGRAEAAAIQREAPVFNSAHANQGRYLGIVRYLVEHEQWDHLVTPPGTVAADKVFRLSVMARLG